MCDILAEIDNVLISVTYCIPVSYSLLSYCMVAATASVRQVRQPCGCTDRMSRREKVNLSTHLILKGYYDLQI